MSDTPKTDRAAFYPGLNTDYDDFSIDGPCVYASFARMLERENAALREAGHLAEKIIVQRTDEIRHLERENAALRASEESLASTVRGLEFELEKAQAENAALRADNERLRAILACYRG